MRLSIPKATICLLPTCLLLSLPAGAQCINPALPIQQLAGKTWAFETSDAIDGAVGIFTAQVVSARGGGGMVGQLSITESAYTQGYGPQQQAQLTGTYTVDPDCSGGVLYFPGYDEVFQYHFVFAAGGTRLFLLAENDNASALLGIPVRSGFALGNHGTAVLLPGPPSCGGANPLSVFAGKWSYDVHDLFSASDGILTASFVGNTGTIANTEATLGLLAHSPAIDMPSVGIYQIYPDCSGGNVSLNNGTNNSYAFVFASPNQIYMVGLSPIPYTSIGPFNIMFGTSVGTAVRY